MKSLVLLFLIPTLASGANEGQIGCELVKAQAEVQATELADPSAFTIVGDPSVTQQQSVAIGLQQSVSGFFRAKQMRQSADAKCDAIYAETSLDLYQKWAVLAAQRKGDIAEQNALDDSMDLQKDYISTLTKELQDRVTTIATMESADSTLISTEQRQVQLAKNLVIEIIPPPDGDLADLIYQANSKEGTAAQLSAKSAATSGWDFVLLVGVRTPIDHNGTTQPFISAQAKYSFGTRAAQRAANVVGQKTIELLNIQNGGYNQTVQRNRIELLRLIDVEQKDQSAVQNEVNRINHLRQPLIGIDSILAKNAISEVDIQLSILNATLAGSKARLEAYLVLLNRFTLIK